MAKKQNSYRIVCWTATSGRVEFRAEVTDGQDLVSALRHIANRIEAGLKIEAEANAVFNSRTAIAEPAA